MMKAVNMKGYIFKFGEHSFFKMEGFGVLNTATDRFMSFDGKVPYVLRQKKWVEACIEGGWPEKLQEVAHA